MTAINPILSKQYLKHEFWKNEKQGKETEIKPVEWWWMKQANDDEWRNMQVLDYGWIGFDFRVKVCEEKKSLEKMEKRKVRKRKWVEMSGWGSG